MSTEDQLPDSSSLDTSKLAGKGIYNILNTILLVGRVFVLSVLVARSLGPSLQGVYSFLITATVVAVQLVILGYPNTLIRFVSQRLALGDRSSASAVVSYVVRRELVLAGLATLFMMALAKPLAAHLAEGIPVWLICLAALAVMPDSLMAISEATFEGLLAYRTLCCVNIVFVPISIAAVVVLLAAGGKVTELLILKVLLSSVRVLVYRRLLIARLRRPTEVMQNGLKRDIRSYVRSLSTIFLFDAVVWQRSEVFFLAYFRSRAEVAFYDIAYMVVGVAMRVVPEKLTDILFPVFSGLESTGEVERAAVLYKTSTRLLFAIAACVATGVFVYAPYFVSMVYGDDYLPATSAIRIFCLASPVIIIARATAYVLYSAGWQRFNVRLSGAAAGLNLILDFLLIPGHGIVGAALANSVTQLFSVVILVSYVLRRKRTGLPWNSLLCTLGAVAVQVAVLKAAQLWLSGWILLVVGGVLSIAAYSLALCALRVISPVEQQRLRRLLSGGREMKKI